MSSAKSAEALKKHASRVSDLPEDLLLGFLAWYTVPSRFRIDHKMFCDLVQTFGLDTQRLPNYPSAPDVYRRAVKENERTSEEITAEEVHQFLIRPFRDTTYQIVRERNPAQGQKMHYEPLANITFDRPSEAITLEPLAEDDDFYYVAEKVHREVLKSYRAWRNCIDDQAVRMYLKLLLWEWDAVCVRPSGGVYFLMPGHKAALGAMQALVAELYKAAGPITVDVVPLVSDENQRAMVRRAFEDESVGEVEKMIGDVADLLAAGKELKPDTWQKIHEKYLTHTRKTVEYGSLLSTQMDRTQAALAILQAQVQALSGKINFDK